MTIAAGFVYDEGIVFCADTKVTNTVKSNESKLSFYSFAEGRCAMFFAISSDDVNYPKSAISRCVEAVEKMDFTAMTMDSVRNSVEFALGEFYRDHIYTHPDRTPTQVYMQLLVGVWLRNQTRLYGLHETVLMPVEEYECVGAGEYLAKYLIKQYKRGNPGPLTLGDATLLATVCVEEAIDYDERCGGEAEIVIMRNSGDISNAHKTATYPNYALPGILRVETWKLLHSLAVAQTNGNADEEAPALVESYCQRIRGEEAAQRRWSGAHPESLSE